jgi:isopenicillin N synthase-like dioxygenase
MKAVAAFFRLPLEEKMALSLESSTCIRGYERIGGQKLEELDANEELPDQKEGFSVRRDSEGGRWLQGKNRWPASYPEFRTVYMRYFDAVGELARTMFRLLALSLDLPEDFFDKYASDEDDISMCRCHHYPPAPAGVAKAQKGVGAHTDFGAMTLLLQDNVGGLEVLRRGTNEWVDVPPVRGTYVVNLGDMMQRWTNDRYKSTMHRVISNRSDMHRYSAAFFCDGPLDTLVSCLPTCVGTGKQRFFRLILIGGP